MSYDMHGEEKAWQSHVIYLNLRWSVGASGHAMDSVYAHLMVTYYILLILGQAENASFLADGNKLFCNSPSISHPNYIYQSPIRRCVGVDPEYRIGGGQ
jgi:hypothetical protein